jgi:hypothetical protein
LKEWSRLRYFSKNPYFPRHPFFLEKERKKQIREKTTIKNYLKETT